MANPIPPVKTNSKAAAAIAIANNWLDTGGSWLLSMFTVCLLLVFPIAFTWLCLDFWPSINAFNVILCTATGSWVIYSLARIITYSKNRHKLLKLTTNLSATANRKLIAAAFSKLNYRLGRNTIYLTEATKEGFYADIIATALFAEGAIYLHIQTLRSGDENILFNRNKTYLGELVNAINIQRLARG